MNYSVRIPPQIKADMTAWGLPRDLLVQVYNRLLSELAVDASKSSEINGLSTSACKKNGMPSTVVKTPVPAFGERDRPKARRKVACVSSRLWFGRTAAAIMVTSGLTKTCWR